MADEVFRGRKDPGGSETSWSQLSCFCGFWKVQGSKVRSSKLISVPSALHDPADLERLLTTLKGSAGRPQIRMGPNERRAQLWASCRVGAHKDRAAFTHRTAWAGVSWSRSHGDIPAQVGPRSSDVTASYDDKPSVDLGVRVPALRRY